MKKILILTMLLCTMMGAFAQNIDESAAINLVNQHKKAIGLSAEDVVNSIVSNAYYNKTSGTQLVYLQQSHKGLPVFNQLQVLAFKNGQLVSVAGSRITSINKLSKMASASPAVTAEMAVNRAMADKNVAAKQALVPTVLKAGQKLSFGKAGISLENITAELMWVPINNGKEIKLAWQVFFAPTTSSDYWLLRVNAQDNSILEESNLTVYCNFDAGGAHEHAVSCSADKTQASNATAKSPTTSPSVINGASYRVVPYPAESPNHPGGTPALVINPWTIAPGNATSLKWHSTGTDDYLYTRGNNVWAYHDRTNNNTGDPTKSATSTTSGDPLTFNFIPDFTVVPTQTTPVENQQFNITNLFYWNNTIHDLLYQYGFDEAAGNFQFNNQGRGGVGNDFVRAEAQDGGGTNNANFSTPADGGSGRMQMYLWNGNPQKDGDVDNGIVLHEFSHGISNRLTGGPSQAGCLGNQEQMGEGWSDFYSLMATHDWATANINDGFSKPRGIGTYATGAPVTGVGIRPRRYTTNMAVNEITYANLPSQVAPHGVGFVWCTMLWDMTWEIIQQAGINPNLFNAAGTGGNTIALKLVTEAMKLQVCSPGFIDGRNAILQADQILYGGQYRCVIIAAFARRGLGFDASQGSSSSKADGVAGFSTVESNLSLIQTVTQQLEGLNVTYTNKIAAGPCSAITNYLLTDTLPSTVTYVSGGTYNAGNRVVSFAVNIAAGQSVDYSFTVKVNNGTWFPTANLIDEKLPGTGIPAGWVTASINANNFTVASSQSQSAPNAFFGLNAGSATDFNVATTTQIPMGAIAPTLYFWHNYNTEDGWDGGVVEISTNNGSSWTDLGANMTVNGYNGSMGTGSNNPIGGRAAFTGNSNGFIRTTVSLAAYANQNALFRFRAGSDDNTAISGWYIDDILLESKPLINITSTLFNASGVKVAVKDTVTLILENAACAPAAISAAPTNVSACAGSDASFTATATGSALGYQWQVSNDAGVSYSNISGATSASYLATGVTAGMNSNLYRVIVSNSCPSTVTSLPATLTVTNAATITAQPADVSVCVNSNTSFVAAATGSNLSYQWQVSSNAGASYTDISGATAATLNLTAVTAGMQNNLYRVVVFSCGPIGSNSAAARLTITNPATFTTSPSSVTICPGDNAVFTAAVSGNNLTYQWQVSSNGGSSFNNVGGATTATLNLNSVNIALNGNQYRVIVNGTCTVDVTSGAATLNVNTPVNINAQPATVSGCAGSNVSFMVGATGTALSYQWQLSINGGAFQNISNSAPYGGATSNTLSVTGITSQMNGYAYRVVVTGTPCGAVTSNVASLIAFSLPSAVLIAAEYNRLTPAVPSSLYTTVSPIGNYSYQWYRNGSLVPGASISSYPVNVDRLGNYTVLVTDANNCTVSTNLVSIQDSASSQLFIYSNPNNGQFQVRYYNSDANPVDRVLTVYDAKGARVFRKQFSVGRFYDRMDVNLRNAQAGVYSVDLRDSKGRRIASGSVIIQ